MKPAFTHKGRPYTFATIEAHWRKNKAALMLVLGQTAVNFFRSRFRAQAWIDKFAKKWQKRAVDLHPEKYSPKQRRQSKGRAILVKSSQLFKSIHMKSYSNNQVIISARCELLSICIFDIVKIIRLFKYKIFIKKNTDFFSRCFFK